MPLEEPLSLSCIEVPGFGHTAGDGCLALIGGGEFSFGETLDADRAWLSKAPEGPIGFVPTASGSTEYGDHFRDYMAEAFEREVEVIPIYRARDARRGKNLDRIRSAAAIYLGGGVTDHLLDTLGGSPAEETLREKLASGGVVVGIAAAAQAAGRSARSLLTRRLTDGLGWLGTGVVEPNFDPGHDRRLRELMAAPGVSVGLGLPAGVAALVGADGQVELSGVAFRIGDAEDDLHVLGAEHA